VPEIHDPEILQELGLRHVIGLIERHGPVEMRDDMSTAVDQISLVWENCAVLASQLQTNILHMRGRFD
jgi:hypothetical protein